MISTELQSRDPDFELLPMFEARIKAAFGLRSIAFFDRFRAECHWLIPHTVGDYACPECIGETLRNRGHITLIKSWRYAVVTICPLHSKILVDYGRRCFSYMQFLSGPSVPLRLNISGSALETVIKIGLKMQVKMLKLEKHLTANPYGRETRELSIYHARRFLMEFFLHAANFGGGLATQFITTPRTSNRALMDMRFKLLMKIGALQANAAERTCSLIMMGIVTGCITHQEINQLNNEMESGRSWWAFRWDPESIGRSCSQIYGSHQQTNSRAIRNALSFFNHRNTKAFIRGIALEP
ncbi:hypothetical protein AO282_06215 [Pseudomonas amygdali pv. morsprunorum]|nr:hypothetical protein AO282_06215 [Pseudomonas amygdali pv. morsprunorum]